MTGPWRQVVGLENQFAALVAARDRGVWTRSTNRSSTERGAAYNSDVAAIITRAEELLSPTDAATSNAVLSLINQATSTLDIAMFRGGR